MLHSSSWHWITCQISDKHHHYLTLIKASRLYHKMKNKSKYTTLFQSLIIKSYNWVLIFIIKIHDIYILVLRALVLFEQSNFLDRISLCFILSLTELYSFFWYPCHVLPVELWETSCYSSSLPVHRKYRKGQSRDYFIIWLIRYVCRIKEF